MARIRHALRPLLTLSQAHPLANLMYVKAAFPRHLLPHAVDFLEQIVIGHGIEGGRSSSGWQITGQA